jgi:hypothetical protein
MIAISVEGYIVSYSYDGHLLSTHSVNGRFIKMLDIRERIYAMCLSEDGKVFDSYKNFALLFLIIIFFR